MSNNEIINASSSFHGLLASALCAALLILLAALFFHIIAFTRWANIYLDDSFSIHLTHIPDAVRVPEEPENDDPVERLPNPLPPPVVHPDPPNPPPLPQPEPHPEPQPPP